MYFKVELDGKKLFGQNCFPILSITPGIKFVPLRSNGGELIPESGLFVRIKKAEGEGNRTMSPISGGVDTSKQLSAIDTTQSLPMNAKFFRSKFASAHDEDMGFDEEDETVTELPPTTASKRRVTSPAILLSKRNGVSSNPSGESTPTPAAVNNGLAEFEVEVEVHEEEKTDALPKSKRKSNSLDVPDSSIKLT